MATRVKGIDTEVVPILNGVAADSVTDVKSLDLTFELEMLEAEYLGESAPRFDEINKGISGKLQVHFEDPAVFDFIAAIIDRASRRDPAVVINIKTTINFPSGAVRRIIIPDAHFGSIPLSIGGRSEFASLSFDFKASKARVIG